MTDLFTKMVCPFEVKMVDDGARTFEGYANTWGLDLGDDVIHPGAFKDVLADWRKSGATIPLLNSHDYWDIFSGIGQMLEAAEDKVGLLTKWEVIDGEDGDRVLTRLRPSKRTGKGVIGSMSIGFQPGRHEFKEEDGRTVRHLYEIRALKETSLVLFPMNVGSLINVSSVKTFLQHGAGPADVAGLRQAAASLADLLIEPTEPSVEDAKQTTPSGAPDTDVLDRLKVQRLRLLAQRS